jgi:hypothetical protein
MLQRMAWGGDEDDGDDAMSDEMVFQFTKCGGSMIPCSEGALLDVEIVSSSIVFASDDMDETFFDIAENRATVRTVIATEVGVNPKQVLLTGISTATSRALTDARGRKLAAATTVDYQITIEAGNPTQKAAVSNSIEAGLAPAAFQTGALAAINVEVQPAMVVTEVAVTADIEAFDKPYVEPDAANHASKAGGSALATALLFACAVALAAERR